MFRRIGLFLMTNLAIILVVSVILSIFNVQPYLTQAGLDYQSLLWFSAIFGMTGSFISLLLSKWMAKRAFRIRMLRNGASQAEDWLLSVVSSCASQKGIGMPEVGIYDSAEVNAFATGWNRNNALVAVSTGLLERMERDEIEAVIAHEVSHVANGDMVTLALIQGVVNTFVIFFARIAAYMVSSFLRRGSDGEGANVGGLAYYMTAIAFEILFGILASMIVMAFSRYREFRADAGSAEYAGSEKMIKALQRLQQIHAPTDDRSPALAAFKISGQPSRFAKFFSSHPPLEQRIKALRDR